jgi:hypothetical protein
MNLIEDANAHVKAAEIRAATEEHVLAVVDDLLDARMQIRGGTAAKVAALLDELYAKPSFGERAGCAYTGDATADHGHGLSQALQQWI